MCLWRSAQIASDRGRRTESRSMSRLRVRPESTMSSTKRMWRPSSTVAAGCRIRAVTRGDEEIYLDGAGNVSNQVTQKYKTSFEQSQDEQVAVGIVRADLGAELAHARGDRSGFVGDALDRATVESWISDSCRHRRRSQ